MMTVNYISKKGDVPIMGRKYGFSFSWKRAVGISGLKNRISRKTRIPLTSQGRQRKVGRMMGCSIALLIMLSIIALSIVAFAKLTF
jgi:hypothetical protein